MDSQPSLTRRDHLAHVIGDIAEAVCDRPGESSAKRAARSQAAVSTIMAFQPGDAIEAMIAGHCVMFHEMIVDSVHATLRGEADASRRAERSGVVAMDKAFGNNLSRLERYRTRGAEASPDAQPAPARAETHIADRVRRHQSQPPVPQPAESAGLDPTWFAKAQGMGQPCEDGLSTAQMFGFNGLVPGNASQPERSAYAGNRQARRHANR
jgi:hypothetical protein